MDPDLAEVVRKAIAFDRLHVHTSLPGKVVSYDADAQTANVQLMVKHPFPTESGIEFASFPELPGVPVMWPEGGGASLQMPLQAGDFVEVCFEEADSGGWVDSGQESAPSDLERHGLSSCFAVPGRRARSGALRSVTGPHFEVVSGNPLTVGQAPASAQFVALSNLVASELSRIQADIATLKGACAGLSLAMDSLIPGTSAAFTTASLAVPSSPSSVASQNLKA